MYFQFWIGRYLRKFHTQCLRVDTVPINKIAVLPSWYRYRATCLCMSVCKNKLVYILSECIINYIISLNISKLVCIFLLQFLSDFHQTASYINTFNAPNLGDSQVIISHGWGIFVPILGIYNFVTVGLCSKLFLQFWAFFTKLIWILFPEVFSKSFCCQSQNNMEK